MKQFYESYKDFQKFASVLREITWTNNLIIFSRCKTIEEKEFYLSIARLENYSKRELDRQISSSLFERTMISHSKLSPVVRESNNLSAGNPVRFIPPKPSLSIFLE